MKKILKKAFWIFGIGITAVIFATVGIDAADHFDNLSESIVGRMIFPPKPEARCPAEMIFVANESGGYCLDKYEDSPNNKCPYQKISGQSNTKENLDTKECQPQSAAQALPWNNISQSQAQAACAKAGKRLPTAEEWYLASLNTPDKTENWTEFDCQVNTNWASQPGLTGSGKLCVSSFGAFDMVGNVWEWVNGEVSEGSYQGVKLPAAGYVKSVDSKGVPLETSLDSADPNFNNDFLRLKEKGTRGIARGGYWDNKAEAGFYSWYLEALPSYAGPGIGFRCVK